MELLLDTHVWAWMLLDDPRLSAPARHAIQNAERLRLSPATFLEIGQKAQLGKWPQMEPVLEKLPGLAKGQGIWTAPMTPELALQAGQLDWTHRDPFDRILAVTALQMGIALISADAMFDTLENDALQRVW